MKSAGPPRLPLLPFLLGDVVLLALAWIVADQHPNPFSPLPLVIIAGSVLVGCILAIIPFTANYVRQREVALAALRQELGEQLRRLATVAEHLQQATTQLKAVEDVATKSLQTAEKLPYRLQEKIAEFNQQLAETDNEEREALEQELNTLRAGESERLASVADKIARATAEWSKLEGATRQQLAAADRLEPRLRELLAALTAKIAALEAAAQEVSHPVPAPAPIAVEVTPPPAPPIEAGNAPAGVVAAADDVPAKPPRRPRAPRRHPAEDPAAAPPPPVEAAAPTPELIVEPLPDDAAPPEDFSQVAPEDGQPAPTPSADGNTRLTVVSYIGIGNKLYLRGEGPGLSWDKGVPLQFVSIGRWRWETGAATGPIRCKVFKNDKIEAPLGMLTLTPGTEQEISASF